MISPNPSVSKVAKYPSFFLNISSTLLHPFDVSFSLFWFVGLKKCQNCTSDWSTMTIIQIFLKKHDPRFFLRYIWSMRIFDREFVKCFNPTIENFASKLSNFFRKVKFSKLPKSNFFFGRINYYNCSHHIIIYL